MNIIHKIPEIFVPALDQYKEILSGNLGLHNMVNCKHYRKDDLIYQEEGENTFMTEGIARILNIIFFTTSKAASSIVYCGLFKNDITPVVGDTAAKLGSGNAYGECQDADYTPATNKPVYTVVSTATAGCTNAAAPASFTMAAAINVYGTFLSFGMAKTDTTGPLCASKRFATTRATQIADVLAITYAISVTTS